jgi:replicative DNA helicase
MINVDGTLSRENLRRNLFYTAQSDLEFLKSEDERIWDFVHNFARSYSEPPRMNTIEDHFEREEDFEVMPRLDEIRAVSNVYKQSDFENLVREKVNEQYKAKTDHLFKEAEHILKDGREIDGTHYKGYRDALRRVMEKSDDLITADDGAEFRSNITKDASKMKEKFRRVLNNMQNAWGRGVGLEPIDRTCKGIKPGELWLHAGFTSELKTTFALNWAYKQAYVFHNNVYYISLEMPVEKIRDIIYVMHSSHPKFMQQGHDPLDYRKIRDGVDDQGNKLTQEEKDFYFKVIDDIKTCDDYGRFDVECPKKDNATIPQIKNRMEMHHQSHPIHIAFLDYFGLVKSHRDLGSFYQEINAIIREAKQMCMNFNKGEKLPLVALHQINREGKEQAEKNNGVYTKRALADANEAERTSDVISYTYLNDDMREEGEVKIGCLKNRDNPLWKPFKANVDFNNRFIYYVVEDDDNIPNNESKEAIEKVLEDDG